MCPLSLPADFLSLHNTQVPTSEQSNSSNGHCSREEVEGEGRVLSMQGRNGYEAGNLGWGTVQGGPRALISGYRAQCMNPGLGSV